MAKKKYYGSLAPRILVLCFLLIIIPLIFYSVIIWDRDWRIKLNTIFSEFKLTGDSELEIYKQWHAFRRAQLENLEANLDDPNLSTTFIVDENFRLRFSSEKRLEGKVFFLPELIEKAYQAKDLVFVALNPLNNEKEIFVLRRFGQEIRGLSIPIAQWLSSFMSQGQFDLSLVDLSDQIIFSSNPSMIEQKKMVFDRSQMEAWHRHVNFAQAYRLRNKHLALILDVPQALFKLQIELSNKQINELEGGSLFQRLAELVVMIILLGGIGTGWLTFRMAKPLRQFTFVMDAVEAKDYSCRYQNDRLGFEINTLGLKFNEMIEVLLKNMETAKNERVKKELFFNELQIGRSVQKELLPKEIPLFPGIKFGLGFVPAKEVGGDFYDLFVKDPNHMMVSIADASDKGISACLYSLTVRSMLRSYCQFEPLADAIVHTNNLFYRDASATSNFVTAWIGFYQVAERKLTYTSAGHLPALLIYPNGQIEELTTSGIALGVSIIETVEVHTIELSADCLLFLYTDGVIEAHNEKGELFGKSRLFEFLKVHRTLEPQQLIDTLVTELGDFSKEITQHDDLTVLCLKNS